MKKQNVILSTSLMTLVVLGMVVLLRNQLFKQTDQITVSSKLPLGFIEELLNNLEIPFIQNQDTLVLESAFKPCGNCSGMLPVQLSDEDKFFIDKLSMFVKRKMPAATDVYPVMDTVRIFSTLNRSRGSTSQAKKIYVLLEAGQSRQNGHLYVYENYLCMDSLKQVLKEFELDKEGNWREVDHRRTK